MTDNKRLIAALVLSMCTVYLWNYFYVTPKLEKQKAAAALVQKQNEASKPATVKAASTFVNTGETENKIVDQVEVNKFLFPNDVIKDGFKQGTRIKISTPKLHGSINLEGATFDDLTLADYKESLDKSATEVRLFTPRRTENIYFTRTGWVAADGAVQVPTDSTIWKLAPNGDSNLDVGKKVILFADNGAGLLFKKTITIDDKQLITVEESVENNTTAEISVAPMGLINRAKTPDEDSYISHEGAISVADNILHEAHYKDLMDDGNKEFKNTTGWAGIVDKYWLAALLPENMKDGKFDISHKFYRKNTQNRFQVDMMGEALSIPPQSKASYKFNIYAGAKKLSYLDEYQEKFNIPLFDRAIDFGYLYFLTKPIFKLLTFFHSLVGNFGLAIMLLTVVIKLVLFPLANKSYKSMAKLKKHMPEMTKMKEKYKDDRQKLSLEMMKYYKEHKINPLSGCLPLLVQLPIFFALYKVLYVTIEMRHAPFYWFIKDLSAKDPTNVLNLFGLIPWAPPAFLPVIGILPILFALSMFLQQKMSPPPSDETQKIVMQFMPLVLLFVFSGFAAGLVVYWIWNNSLSILQQWVITKQVEEDKNA